MSRGFLDCLKRERDIFIKPTLSGEKRAFMCTPALTAHPAHPKSGNRFVMRGFNSSISLVQYLKSAAFETGGRSIENDKLKRTIHLSYHCHGNGGGYSP